MIYFKNIIKLMHFFISKYKVFLFKILIILKITFYYYNNKIIIFDLLLFFNKLDFKIRTIFQSLT